MAAATFPPKTSPEDESRLLSQAVDWALSNGLVIRPPPTQTSPAPSGSAVHAPFSLYPSLFPSSAFTLAVQLQPLFNKLVDRLARDHAFISDIMDK